MTTRKRSGGVRFAGTRIALVAGAVTSFLAIWLHVARSSYDGAGQPAGASATDSTVRLITSVSAAPGARGDVSRPAEAEPSPTAVPQRTVSRGS
jgi:hypothetical protein